MWNKIRITLVFACVMSKAYGAIPTPEDYTSSTDTSLVIPVDKDCIVVREDQNVSLEHGHAGLFRVVMIGDTFMTLPSWLFMIQFIKNKYDSDPILDIVQMKGLKSPVAVDGIDPMLTIATAPDQYLNAAYNGEPV